MSVTSDVDIYRASADLTGKGGETQVSIRVNCGTAPTADVAYDDAVPPVARDARHVTVAVLPGLSFRISDGALIEIFRSSEVTDADVNLFLVGTAFGILCHQRGLLPLHCSAIDFHGALMAFTGDSGMGKSTLAAGLGLRRHPHVSDDVMVVAFDANGPSMAPLPKGLKLCHDAIEHLGIEPGEPVGSLDNHKSYVALAGVGADAGRMACALHVLAYHDDDRPAIVEPLKGVEAWNELYRSVYRIEMLPAIAAHSDVAARVAIVARHMPVFRFTRPRGLALFDTGLDVLERHMLDLVEGRIEGLAR